MPLPGWPQRGGGSPGLRCIRPLRSDTTPNRPTLPNVRVPRWDRITASLTPAATLAAKFLGDMSATRTGIAATGLAAADRESIFLSFQSFCFEPATMANTEVSQAFKFLSTLNNALLYENDQWSVVSGVLSNGHLQRNLDSVSLSTAQTTCFVLVHARLKAICNELNNLNQMITSRKVHLHTKVANPRFSLPASSFD
jgi:hypothetical protein